LKLFSPFFCAVTFLTQIPVPQSWYRHEDFQHSLRWFACVGWLIGGITALIMWELEEKLYGMLAGCAIIITLQLLCGGFHMDGLADSADGLWSSRTREKMLEIMRDSRTGSMGVLCLIIVVLTSISALSQLPIANLWKAALLAPVAGRIMCMFHTLALPYARESGLANGLFLQRPYLSFGIHSIILCVTANILLPESGIAGCVAAVLTGLVWSWFCKKKLGGATGDTSGATVELTTCAFWVGMALS